MVTDAPTPRPTEVIVLGSLNMDLRVHTPRLPQVGETLLGGNFGTDTGGKGANQAVAAAKAGAKVAMMGRVGNDAFGEALVAALESQGIHAHHVIRDPKAASGIGMIMVMDDGDNSIVVAPGANHQVSVTDVKTWLPQCLPQAKVLVLQLEVPLEAVIAALELAHAASVTTLLNLAPAASLPKGTLHMVDVLVLNQTEAEMLAHTEPSKASPSDLIDTLLTMGPRHVVLTLGSQGLLYAHQDQRIKLPAHKVTPVDTTGAGDTLVGVLAAGLGSGLEMIQALGRAQAAAALTVTRHGAQSSMPTALEIVQFIESHPISH